MLGTKRVRKNRFRKKTVKKRRIGPAALLNFAAGMTALAALSIAMVFCHDLITQLDYFRAETVKVSGCRHLTREAILTRALLEPGMNILAVNLTKVRKRLLSHPWIAEAVVHREIPRTIHIRVEEHRPAAVLDLGRKFLVDPRGVVFKEMAPGEEAGLPMIQGLRFSDIRIEALGRTGERRAAVYDDVIAVLKLGTAAAADLPIAAVGHIVVDRETGLRLQTAGPESLEIRLGFTDYERKFDILQTVLKRLGQSQALQWEGIGFIDLHDPSRIVVRPKFMQG